MTPAARAELVRAALNAPTGPFRLAGGGLAALGTVIFLVLLAGDDPGRAWRAYHQNFLFFTGLALGGVVFAAIQRVAKAVWAGALIRFAQAGVAFLPVSLVLFVLLFLGREHLFPWIAHPTPARGAWLTTPFLFWRDLAALLLVFGVAGAYVWHDLRPDLAAMGGEVSDWRQRLYRRIAGDYRGTPEDVVANERTLGRLAPLVLITYAYCFSLIGFDLVMSLAPYWVSTLLGAFFFMGAFLTGLTTLGLMMVYWRNRLGLQGVIGRQQFHDLGKLIFGFSVFWAYLMFSQVLVIWYGNLPEETSFVFWRLWGAWRPISILVGLLVFLVPFWGLIWVKSKVTPLTFTVFVTISLAGMWLERYLLITPSLTEHGPSLGLPELGVTLLFLGLFLVAWGTFARAFPIVSPRLAAEAETLHH